MKDHFLQLFSYENWAMQKIISLLQESQDAEAIQIFQHILLARELWHNRVADKNNPYIFDGKSVRECVEAFNRNQTEWIEFIENCDDYERILSYKNLKGEPYSNQIKNILTHVVNHSTYHRGQITLTLKGKVKLFSTDFIYYFDENV